MALIPDHIYVEFCKHKKRKYKRKDAKRHSWEKDRYKVLAVESFSETGKGYIVIANDSGELWWVENRDVRVLRTKKVNS